MRPSRPLLLIWSPRSVRKHSTCNSPGPEFQSRCIAQNDVAGPQQQPQTTPQGMPSPTTMAMASGALPSGLPTPYGSQMEVLLAKMGTIHWPTISIAAAPHREDRKLSEAAEGYCIACIHQPRTRACIHKPAWAHATASTSLLLLPFEWVPAIFGIGYTFYHQGQKMVIVMQCSPHPSQPSSDPPPHPPLGPNESLCTSTGLVHHGTFSQIIRQLNEVLAVSPSQTGKCAPFSTCRYFRQSSWPRTTHGAGETFQRSGSAIGSVAPRSIKGSIAAEGGEAAHNLIALQHAWTPKPY